MMVCTRCTVQPPSNYGIYQDGLVFSPRECSVFIGIRECPFLNVHSGAEVCTRCVVCPCCRCAQSPMGFAHKRRDCRPQPGDRKYYLVWEGLTQAHVKRIKEQKAHAILTEVDRQRWLVRTGVRRDIVCHLLNKLDVILLWDNKAAYPTSDATAYWDDSQECVYLRLVDPQSKAVKWRSASSQRALPPFILEMSSVKRNTRLMLSYNQSASVKQDAMVNVGLKHAEEDRESLRGFVERVQKKRKRGCEEPEWIKRLCL